MAGRTGQGLSLIWPLIAAVIAVDAGSMMVVGFRLDWGSVAVAVAACLICEALAIVYRDWRPDARLAAALTSVAQIVSFSAAAACLSYVVASASGHVQDDTLASWDRALGLDWRAYIEFVDHRPWLAWVYGAAYASFQLQLVLVPVALGFSGRSRALDEFVLSFMLSASAAVLISGIMPAVEMYVHLGLDPGHFPHIPPTGAQHRAAILAGLRDGSIGSISLREIEGIITFPSFHTAGAVLVAAAMWESRSLRWPVLALDAVMVAATPVYGGHYFVDVLAGGMVATLALGSARLLSPHRAAATRPAVADVAPVEA